MTVIIMVIEEQEGEMTVVEAVLVDVVFVVVVVVVVVHVVLVVVGFHVIMEEMM